MSSTENQPLTIKDIPIVKNKDLKKAIVAVALGNAVEWFDFAVFAYLVGAIGKNFFSELPPSTQIVVTFALFSVTFIFRPLGGVVFGALGDKYGRKSVLAFTIVLMTASTACIGLLPTSHNPGMLGVMAPFLLLLIKIIQGLSVGGEYTGAVVFVSEYSPDRKRGFMASWLDFGSIAGFLLGASVVALLTYFIGQDNINDWGWRIPFLLSLPLGIIGLYLRKHLDETPTYEAQMELEDQETVTYKEIFQQNWRNIIVCCGIVIATNTTYYMLLTYLPTYLSSSLGYPEAHGNRIIIIVMICMLFMQPLIGYLSDKIGRKPFIFAGSFILLFFSIPAFWLIQHEIVWMVFIGIGIIGIALCSFIGVMASILPALFPTDVRFRSLGISFNITVAIAGLTPTIAAALVEKTGNLYIPAFYLMLVAVIIFVIGIFMHETANRPLKDSPPVASNKQEAKEVLQDHFDHIEDRVTAIDDKISTLEEKRQELVDQHPKLN